MLLAHPPREACGHVITLAILLFAGLRGMKNRRKGLPKDMLDA